MKKKEVKGEEARERVVKMDKQLLKEVRKTRAVWKEEKR